MGGACGKCATPPDGGGGNEPKLAQVVPGPKTATAALHAASQPAGVPGEREIISGGTGSSSGAVPTGAPSNQPWPLNDALDPAVRAKLTQLVEYSSQRPDDFNGIARLAREVSCVADGMGEASAPTRRENMLSSQTAGGVPEHKLVLSTRRTTVVPAFPDIPPDRCEFIESQAGLWDALVLEMNGDEHVTYLESLYHKLDLVQQFNIPEGNLRRFLLTIRSLYHEENPYHNFIHGTDCASGVFHLLMSTNAQKTLSPLEVLGLLTAAIGHDVDHPGVNQAFEQNIKSDIALIHNFRSVLGTTTSMCSSQC